MAKTVTQIFNNDIEEFGGYEYTTSQTLSSVYVRERLLTAICDNCDLSNKRFLDIGCGDGYFTRNIFERSKVRLAIGVDVADKAIMSARSQGERKNLKFLVGSGNSLPFSDCSFDVAVLQSILHHDECPIKTIEETLRVAKKVIVVESNGNNLAVQLLSRLLLYHRKHKEKSYFPITLLKWMKQAGGRVTCKKYVNFVPLFCPDWFAEIMKRIELVVERLPVVRMFVCSVYIVIVENRDDSSIQDSI